jgi:hypothetical protein
MIIVKPIKGILFFLVFCSCIVLLSGFQGGQERVKPVQAVLQPTAPVQISPADRTVFHQFPRTFTMVWQGKRGVAGVTYEVEIDCLDCTQPGKWDSDVGTSRKLTNLTDTLVCYTFPADNRGRWRVRAKIGRILSRWSPWWGFSFKTPVVSMVKPNICIDGLLKIGNRVSPWGQNYTVTLTPQDAFVRTGGKAGFDVHYVVKNCKGGAVSGFENHILFNNIVVSKQANLSLGAVGSTLPIHTQVYLIPQNGVFKIRLDAGNVIDEDWENDNDVWVNVQFSGF